MAEQWLWCTTCDCETPHKVKPLGFQPPRYGQPGFGSAAGCLGALVAGLLFEVVASALAGPSMACVNCGTAKRRKA